MNKEDIINMARGCGLFDVSYPNPGNMAEVERFADLVAAHEREACAKVCEEKIKSYMSKKYTTEPLGGYCERFAAEQCASAIRERGNK